MNSGPSIHGDSVEELPGWDAFEIARGQFELLAGAEPGAPEVRDSEPVDSRLPEVSTVAFAADRAVVTPLVRRNFFTVCSQSSADVSRRSSTGGASAEIAPRLPG